MLDASISQVSCFNNTDKFKTSVSTYEVIDQHPVLHLASHARSMYGGTLTLAAPICRLCKSRDYAHLRIAYGPGSAILRSCQVVREHHVYVVATRS
jgi:hypothetical protein